MVKIVEFKDILLLNGVLKRYSNSDFYKSISFKVNQVLEILEKQQRIFVLNVFINQYYFALIIGFIEVKVKIAKI